jgi:glycogen debranching enzyme
MPATDLAARVRAVLHGNRVTAAGGRYTRPARQTYPHQWLWDSCFHAIIYGLLGEPEHARDELRALFRAQETEGPDRGRLPHMTLLGGAPGEAAQDPDGAAAFARDTALWGNPRCSTLTQPPVVAEAVLRVGDPALWRELWQPLCAYYDWWLRRRDPHGEGLYAIWHPWESGADATPRVDEAMELIARSGRTSRQLANRTVNPTAKKRDDLLRARFVLLEDLQAIDAAERAGTTSEHAAQQQRAAALGHVGADIQAYLVRNLLDLATIGERLGEPTAAYRAAAARIADAVNARLWDEEAGFYFDRWGPEAGHVARVRTPAAFTLLYAGELVPRERAARLLDQLLDPARFWTRWPVPTVARDDTSFDPDEYWRGSAWVNVNWFVVRGLCATHARWGDTRCLRAARAIAERTVEVVGALGLREYYRAGARHAADDAAAEPAAFGPADFGWSGLALDLAHMLDRELAGVEAWR